MLLPSFIPLLVLVSGALICGLFLVLAFRAFWRQRLINDNPTSKAQGVFIGLTEVKGTAEAEAPLTSYLAAARCIYYAWQVQEHWSRTVTETYRDAQGRMHTRTRTESGWQTVADDRQSIPFYIKDDTGVVRVLPEKASIEGVRIFDKTVSRGDPLYFDRGPASEIANSTHRRRFVETIILLHAPLYVVGQARQRQDVAAAEIAYDKNCPMFVISTRSEKQVSAGFGLRFWLWLTLGIIIALATALGWQLMLPGGSPAAWQPYAIAGVIYLLAAALGWTWTVYNSFVNLHHRVEQAWSQVDIQLKRRSDLIPNLVHAVEGYREHEKLTQTLLAALRSQSTATPPGVAGPDFKSLLPEIRVTVESYPELKANQSFLSLQQALVDSEQRIALARDYFNEITTFYNTRLEVFPDRWLGAIARLRPRLLLSSADFERAPVPVNLAD